MNLHGQISKNRFHCHYRLYRPSTWMTLVRSLPYFYAGVVKIVSMNLVGALIVFFLLAGHPVAYSKTDSAELPLLHIDDFYYAGAFRLLHDTFGASSLNYSEGPLEYDAASHSIFVVGHSHHQAIAEFAVPELVCSNSLADLRMSGAPLQNFVPILNRTSSGNPQNLNRIGGMEVFTGISGRVLLVNAYEYYDAPGDNTQTSAVVKNAGDIAGSSIDGYYAFQGGAGHTSGWISPIPAGWQAILGGTHITGQSSGIPIISRTSVGPSAFAFNGLDEFGSSSVDDPVATVTLLDFSLSHPLHDDLSNSMGTNNLWTHLSRVVFGFIVPGTRTYVTLGHSGGHASGVCYKCTQDDGTLCGGYCAPDSEDYYHYYWLWDVNDLVAVKAGSLAAYEVRPYEYGILPSPFVTRELGGGTFDPYSGTLYLTVQRADRLQGPYSNPPVVVAYQFRTDCLDAEDLVEFAADFGSTKCACCQGDINGDGDLDGADLSKFADKICR